MGALVACAVLRGEPPTVFLAADIDTLQWRLATEIVARADREGWPDATRTDVRRALLEERWADAVLAWMSYSDVVVDVYPSVDVTEPVDRQLAAVELQFTPLFRDLT